VRCKLNRARQNKYGRHCSKQNARGEAREVIVLPDSEVGKTKIDR
jgi:hypothetical protein